MNIATIGGMGHLLSFRGSDTMSAAYYAQFEMNNGKPVAQSIPATEHSVMTSWPSEEEAIHNMIKHFGNGFFACVLDSYDYENCQFIFEKLLFVFCLFLKVIRTEFLFSQFCTLLFFSILFYFVALY